MLYNKMCLDLRIILAPELGHLQFTQIRTDNKDKFDVIRVRYCLEHIQYMLKRRLARHTDQRLGLAPGMRAHARPPAGHGNKNLKSFCHDVILPPECSAGLTL